MVYVSEVVVGESPVKFARVPVLGLGSADVKYLDSSDSAIVFKPTGVVIGRVVGGGYVTYVRHSKQAVKFLEYVESYETRNSDLEGATGYFVSLDDLLDNPPESATLVSVEDITIVVVDSIVRMVDHNKPEVSYMSLYDMVCWCIRHIEGYILDEKVLIIDSGISHKRTVIRLKQSQEAKRFFAKMQVMS